MTLMGTLRPKQCGRPNCGHEMSTKDPGSQRDAAPYGEGSWVEGVVHPSTLAPSAIPTAELSPEVRPGPPPPSQALSAASILIPQAHAGHSIRPALLSATFCPHRTAPGPFDHPKATHSTGGKPVVPFSMKSLKLKIRPQCREGGREYK